MLNKAMHKTRCKCMRKEKEKKRSIHGDNTNVLAKEFKPFAIKRFARFRKRPNSPLPFKPEPNLLGIQGRLFLSFICPKRALYSILFSLLFLVLCK